MAKSKYGKKPMSGGKKFLFVLGVIVLLVALFFLSFWVTSMSLRFNQEPDNSVSSGLPVATNTPTVDLRKLSKKELIALVEEKDEKIKELEDELEKGSISTQAPIVTTKPSQATIQPATTSKPSVNTSAPTKVPTPKPVVKTPAPIKTSTPKTAEPTSAPATKVPEAIKPVAPAANEAE